VISFANQLLLLAWHYQLLAPAHQIEVSQLSFIVCPQMRWTDSISNSNTSLRKIFFEGQLLWKDAFLGRFLSSTVDLLEMKSSFGMPWKFVILQKAN